MCLSSLWIYGSLLLIKSFLNLRFAANECKNNFCFAKLNGSSYPRNTADAMVPNKQSVSSVIAVEFRESLLFLREGGWQSCVVWSRGLLLWKVNALPVENVENHLALPCFSGFFLWLSLYFSTFPSLIKCSCLGYSRQFPLYKGNVGKRCIFRKFRPWSKLLTNKLYIKNKILWLSKES